MSCMKYNFSNQFTETNQNTMSRVMWSPNLTDIIQLVFKCFGVIRTSITWQINMDSTTEINFGMSYEHCKLGTKICIL